MALKQYFNIVLVPLKFIPKRTASFWQTIKIPNRFVLKICTGGFADYTFYVIGVALCFYNFASSKINVINQVIRSLKTISVPK